MIVQYPYIILILVYIIFILLHNQKLGVNTPCHVVTVTRMTF